MKCSFSVVLVVKNLPANAADTKVRPLSWEDPLKKEMAIQSSILAMENSMDREAWRVTAHGVAKRWARMSTCQLSA